MEGNDKAQTIKRAIRTPELLEREYEATISLTTTDEKAYEEVEATSDLNENRGVRLNARNLIREEVDWHQRIAYQYEVLLKAIPQDLSEEADEALWNLVCNARRN